MLKLNSGTPHIPVPEIIVPRAEMAKKSGIALSAKDELVLEQKM